MIGFGALSAQPLASSGQADAVGAVFKAQASAALTAGRIVSGAASFVVLASVSAQGARQLKGQASFSAQASVAVSGIRARTAQATLITASVLAAAGRRVAGGQAAIAASATLLGGGSRRRNGQADLSGSSALVGTGRRVRAASALLRGTAGLSGSGRTTSNGRATLRGTATLTGRGIFATGSGARFSGNAFAALDPVQRIYAATTEFLTRPADTPASAPFAGTLQKVIRFDRSIINGGRIGMVTAGWGEMELTNAEGDYDGLIERFAVDGRRIVVKVGEAGAAYNDFFTFFDGTAADWNVEEDVLRIMIRDNTYRLEVPAQPLLYGGTGGLDGTEDLAGKRKPLALGECLNVTPVDLIPNELVRQVSSGPVQGIGPVYDKAVALAFAADYPTGAALRAASTGAQGSGAAIEAGRYATCLTEGLFRLGGAPVGTVTCTVRGDARGGAYVNTTAGIIRRLLAVATDIGDPAGLVTSSFAAVDARQPAVVGYWLDGGTDRTVADVVADLMGAVGGWGGMRRNGRFEVGVFRAPTGVPTAYYDRVDIIDIDRPKLPDGLSPPPYRFRVAWGRNNTVQTDVDGQAGVTQDRVAFLREQRRLASSNAVDGRRIRINHPLAQDPQPVEAYFRDEADALAEAERLIALYGPTSSLYRMKIATHPFSHEIGDVIHVTFDRWDLKQGRLLRVVQIGDDTDTNQIEIIGFG